MKIRLGPAGNCLLSKGEDTLDSLKNLSKFKLTAQEIEFVRNIYMDNNMAKKVGELAKKLDIELSIHSSYYINLASTEKIKIEQSKQRILDSCERGHYLGATYVVFHPAYYGKRSKEEVFGIVKKSIMEMQDFIEKKGWDVKLAPETTGKHSAFGDLDETIRLVKETGCSINVDFAHLFARNRATIDYGGIFDKLNPLKLKHMQSHFSNIEWTLKGEREHLVLDSNPPFEPLAKEVLKRKINITIISETPDTWKGSLKMRKIFEDLGHKF